MQVGDLVVKKGKWAKHNAWMTGTLLDDGDKQTYGLVVNFHDSIYGVMWLDGSAGWYEPAELEVVSCK
tara:strand:- start:189 stop:392 length:204 start_codon:yes stop_codon:yes gene_type:complete